MIRFISHHLGNRSHNERQRFEDYIRSQPSNVNRPYQTIVGLTGMYRLLYFKYCF